LFNSALGLAGIEIGGITPFNFNGDHYNFRKYWEENRTEFITTGVFFFIFHIDHDQHVIHQSFPGKTDRKMDKEITGIFPGPPCRANEWSTRSTRCGLKLTGSAKRRFVSQRLVQKPPI
jgi:hypothetical protein